MMFFVSVGCARSFPPDSTDDAYPYPEPALSVLPSLQSYPEPSVEREDPTITPLVLPTPGPDTGVVIGQIIDIETKQPLAFGTVYLGFKTLLTPGPGYTYGINERTSPHAIMDDKGKFAIGDVPPGNYIVIVFHPRAASVVMIPNTDKELEVKVRAGEAIDIGTVQAKNPYPNDLDGGQ